jgi:hypothetical protein
MMLTISKGLLDKPAIPIAEKKTNEGEEREYVYVEANHSDPNPVVELDGEFDFLPYIEPNQRQAVFISGVSGSGKSTSAVNYIKKLRSYKNKYKKYPVYLWTGNDAPDQAFDNLKNMFRINIQDTESLGELSYSEFQDCIVVFDDWEALEPEMLNYFRGIMKKLLEYSRKQNVIIIIITHMTQQGHLTKPIIFECDTYILYHKNNFNACKKFLKNYMDLENDTLDKIKKMQGRCIYVRKSFPTCVISDNKIILV